MNQHERTLSLAETCTYVGLSRWTIRRMYREGKFPPPIQLTDIKIGWRISTLDAWLESRQRRVYA